jgi:transcriptional regulator with XRE-family HTH domain
LPPPANPTFAENLRRLKGLHDLNDRKLAVLVRATPQTLSLWQSGKRLPISEHLTQLEFLFGVSGGQLMAADFETLLPLVADPDRFKATERRIKRGSSTLRSL